MDSIRIKLNIVFVFTAALCLGATLSLGDGPGRDFRPSLNVDGGATGYMVLAQSSATPAAAAAAAEPKRDTVYLQAPAAGKTKTAFSKEDMNDLMDRRDHFQRMQSTGFGLIMGGIACGAGGLLLMITGLNEMSRSNGYDEYGYETHSDKGEGTFFLGYFILGVGTPAFLTTGIILNRIGNHKRRRYQDEIDDAGGHVRLDMGVNSMRLSYSF